MKIYLLIVISICLNAELMAQNWVRQNPNPIMSELKDVFVNEDGVGWSVGSDNAMLSTNDNGLTWIIEDNGFEEWNFTGVLYVGNDTWIVSGDNGVIRSIDQGVTWVTVDVQIGEIKTLDLFNDQLIIALSDSHIARSHDQGNTWEILDGVDDDHFEVFFVDNDHGWMTDEDQKALYQTTDGGQGWAQIYDHIQTVSGQTIDEIYFQSITDGYLLVGGSFLSTTDGGINWDIKYHSTFVSPRKDFVITPSGRFVSQTSFGTFYSSDNDGSSWRSHSDVKRFGSIAGRLRIAEDGTIWSTNEYTSVVRSIDNGEDYTEQVGGFKESLRDIEMYDENFGVAVSNLDHVLITTNGGGSWEPHLVEEDITGISYVIIENPLEFKVACTRAVYGTIDGGMNWSKLLTTDAANTGFYKLGPDRYIVISARKHYYITDDGGQNWTDVLDDSGLPGNIQKAFFLDDLNGWAVGFDGYVKKTIDGGNTWAFTNIPDNEGRPFYDVEFTTSTNGWILDNGDLYKTEDGGLSWTLVTLDGIRSSNLIFFDEQEGFLFGLRSGKHIYLRTSDGGETWTENDTPSDLSIFDIEQSADGDKMWICGEGGDIEVSAACGDSPTISAINMSTVVCPGDTVVANIQFDEVTIFDWDVPQGWRIVGNSNSSQVQILIGEMAGNVQVAGSNGCEITSPSSIMIDVTPNFADVDIIRAGSLLSLAVSADTYQWYLNGLPIAGADDATFSALASGIYTVEISKGVCNSVLSNSYNYIISSTEDDTRIQFGSIHPNPTDGYLHITLKEPINHAQISIYDLSGRIIDQFELFEDDTIDLHHLSPNIYFLKWITSDGSGIKKLMIN